MDCSIGETNVVIFTFFAQFLTRSCWALRYFNWVYVN